MNKTFKTFLRLSGETGAFAAISGVFSSPYDQPVVVRGRVGKRKGVVRECKRCDE
jgi:hypothetical protein